MEVIAFLAQEFYTVGTFFAGQNCTAIAMSLYQLLQFSYLINIDDSCALSALFSFFKTVTDSGIVEWLYKETKAHTTKTANM